MTAPSSSELRLVGDRLTSGPLRIAAALDSHGDIRIYFRGAPTPEDLSHVLGAAIATAARAVGASPTLLGLVSVAAAEEALRRGGGGHE